MNKNKELLPFLHQIFHYDTETGKLYWKMTRRRDLCGKEAGFIDCKDRLRVEVRGKGYPVHHVIFAMHNDRWPKEQIDHIDQDKLNNRLSNLREASNAENSRNRKSNSMAKGVSYHKGRFIARIMKDGISYNLGSFSDPLPAENAYQAASIKLHGDFACPNN